jgi:hypothetical protein
MIETKEYPEGDEISVTELSVTYTQENEMNSNIYDTLKASICSNGDTFYFLIETKRWSFNSIEELIKVLEDFKEKAKI